MPWIKGMPSCVVAALAASCMHACKRAEGWVVTTVEARWVCVVGLEVGRMA